jgi:Domain of unknown function (DUF2760)
MPGLGKRISYAFKSFFGILSSGEIPREVARELIQPAREARPLPAVESRDAEKPVETSDRAVQMLAILQRDGRLIDFLTEDIAPYSDAQVGAAVRDLHESCRQTIERYIKLEPIISSAEGQTVTVKEPVDPSAIKLIGNVTGRQPLAGVLRHRGWRAVSVSLPPLPESAGRSVVAPAEVEIP